MADQNLFGPVREFHSSEEKGTTMLEFALVLPLISLLVFGIVQYGIIFNSYITLVEASAVAARYATLSSPTPTTSNVQAMAIAASQPGLVSDHLDSPTVNSITVGGVAGATEVVLTYHQPVYFPVPGSSGNEFLIQARTVMR